MDILHVALKSKFEDSPLLRRVSRHEFFSSQQRLVTRTHRKLSQLATGSSVGPRMSHRTLGLCLSRSFQ